MLVGPFDVKFVPLLMSHQYNSAKDAYMRVLDSDPNHAKVLQQLGWLHHQQSNNFASQELAIEYLEKSVSAGKLKAFILLANLSNGRADCRLSE